MRKGGGHMDGAELQIGTECEIVDRVANWTEAEVGLMRRTIARMESQLAEARAELRVAELLVCARAS